MLPDNAHHEKGLTYQHVQRINRRYHNTTSLILFRGNNGNLACVFTVFEHTRDRSLAEHNNQRNQMRKCMPKTLHQLIRPISNFQG